MMSSTRIYKADENYLPADVYNTLPRVNLAKVDEEEQKWAAARGALLQTISDYGLEDVFSLHLLHRHYDLPASHAMVYEQSPYPPSDDLPFFEICRPRCIHSLEAARKPRGKFFFYRQDTETMSAYEHTTEIGPDITSPAYESFIDDFCRVLLKLKAENVFALSLSSPSENSRILYETEVPAYKATLRLEKADWVPDGFNTDWISSTGEMGGVYPRCVPRGANKPGDKHSRRRNSEHHRTEFIGPTDSTSVGVIWDGKNLDNESVAYSVLLKARELIIH
ncbi:hypothetical protein GTR04_5646 [Trichophyton interdigitale]|nr:hypothetical protein GY631_2754 [Trichophyton interdigitale]KAG5218509.1 hypothetical protein GY632_5484 [Trichophyton interdigitale]KAG8206973.1 hypothetical protein GTR04_5646 [Trichophyton interdigitale]